MKKTVVFQRTNLSVFP